MTTRHLRLLLLLIPTVVSARDRSQARSMTITTRGIVATAQTLASQAGAQILARGGSAVDAAIAEMRSLIGINPSGWSPQGLATTIWRNRA